jgi:hypothetical protein
MRYFFVLTAIIIGLVITDTSITAQTIYNPAEWTKRVESTGGAGRQTEEK